MKLFPNIFKSNKAKESSGSDSDADVSVDLSKFSIEQLLVDSSGFSTAERFHEMGIGSSTS